MKNRGTNEGPKQKIDLNNYLKDEVKILIVDDIQENRELLASILKRSTPYITTLADIGKAALASFEQELADLVLLDVMMPEMGGYEVAKILKNKPDSRDIPIIFITALSDIDSKVKAFEMGGVDYIIKPFNKHELLVRINAQVGLKKMHDELWLKNKLLEDREMHLAHLVEEKTIKLENTTQALVSALENANLFNDNDTGNHIRRVSGYLVLVAEEYGCDRNFIKRIKLYASLHDVGKVGISDNILKKPGEYSPEEFQQMQKHVRIGARMLSNTEIDQMAQNIALYHHEKWNGSGYVQKLRNVNIPLEARIVS